MHRPPSGYALRGAGAGTGTGAGAGTRGRERGRAGAGELDRATSRARSRGRARAVERPGLVSLAERAVDFEARKQADRRGGESDGHPQSVRSLKRVSS